MGATAQCQQGTNSEKLSVLDDTNLRDGFRLLQASSTKTQAVMGSVVCSGECILAAPLLQVANNARSKKRYAHIVWKRWHWKRWQLLLLFVPIEQYEPNLVVQTRSYTPCAYKRGHWHRYLTGWMHKDAGSKLLGETVSIQGLSESSALLRWNLAQPQVWKDIMLLARGSLVNHLWPGADARSHAHA